MQIRIFAALVGAFLMLAPAAARADLMFGTQEDIHFIQDVEVTGPEGEELFLGFKTTTQFFLAGLYVQDDGYVLGQRSDHNRYWDMPAGEQLADFQARGLIPDPLPSYELGIFDYLFGYSMWIFVLPIVFLSYFFSWRRKRHAAEPA
ncbi:MAG TPA: hypothetical protein VHG92_04765 [Afifellaceae bacterium]|nr:hypothetical protein [Afifellaceae bacterium]